MSGLQIRYTLYPWIYVVYRYGIPTRIRMFPVCIKEIYHEVETESTDRREPTRTGLGRYYIVRGLISPSPTWRSTDPRYKRDPPGGPKASNLIAKTTATAYEVGAYRSQLDYGLVGIIEFCYFLCNLWLSSYNLISTELGLLPIKGPEPV